MVGNLKEVTRDVSEVGIIQMYCGTVAPIGWLMCKGETLSDTGDGGDYADPKYKNLFTLLKGNDFGNAGTEVWGTDTVKLPNMQGVGITGVGTQDINTRPKGGDSLGETVEDAFQGHHHSVNAQGISSSNVDLDGGSINNYDYVTLSIGDPEDDGSHGVPRFESNETKISSVVLNFIIKY